MKLSFALIIGMAGHTVLASPVVQRDDSTDLATLISSVKNHTASISEHYSIKNKYTSTN